MFRGTEIKKLVLVSTLCCVLLIASVSLYLMVSSRNNLRDQTTQMKQAMARQIAEDLQSCYASMEDYLKTMGIGFGSTLRDPSNSEAIGFYTTAFQKAYDADFVIYHADDGRIISTAKDPSLAVPDLPRGIAGDDEYVILNEVGGREGTFLVLDKEGILPGDEAIFVIENTEQIEMIRQAYEEEKSSDIRQQVIWVSIIFLAFLMISLLIIHSSITQLLEKPISRLSKEAREIVGGRSIAEEEVREGSIFANLQRLVNSGRVILGKVGKEAGAAAAPQGRAEKRETNKVIAVWAVVTTLLFLAGTIILLVASISLTNQKTEAILDNVDREMASYWSGAYDTIIEYAWTHPSVYIGKDLWDPDSTIDREQTIERLVEMVRYSFNCDASVAYLDDVTTPGGGKYVTFVKPGVELKEPLLERMGDPIAIHEGYYREGDLVMVLMNTSEYPGFGEDQFMYYVVDVTQQANVLEDLYRSGSSSLLATQLWLSLLFLTLCLVLSPLAMAWATMRYITRPILELDAVSERLIEGDLDVEITVDERSSFADIQRLLVRARELLRLMA